MAWIATIASALIGAAGQSAASSKAASSQAAASLAAKQKAGASSGYEPTAGQFQQPRMEQTARSVADFAKPQVVPPAAPAAGVEQPPQQTTPQAGQQGGTDWGKLAQLGSQLASTAMQPPAPPPQLQRPQPMPYTPTAARLQDVYRRRSRYPTY